MMLRLTRQHVSFRRQFSQPLISLQLRKNSGDKSNQFSVTRPDERVDIRMRSTGNGARPPKTFIDVFRKTVSENRHRDALKCKEKIDGKVTDKWKTWSWQDYWDDSISFAKSLIKLDINMHKIINIIGFNSVSD